jgi:hypothetical protein
MMPNFRTRPGAVTHAAMPRATLRLIYLPTWPRLHACSHVCPFIILYMCKLLIVRRPTLYVHKEDYVIVDVHNNGNNN